MRTYLCIKVKHFWIRALHIHHIAHVMCDARALRHPRTRDMSVRISHHISLPALAHVRTSCARAARE
jgi:hypothetical protein